MAVRIDYDHNPNATIDQKLKTLKDSVQRAFEEISEGSTVKETVIIQQGGFPGNNEDIIPVASKNMLGCVKIGDNINVDENGVISVDSTGISSGTDVLEGLPLGSIIQWAYYSDSVPSGWLICNGQAISRTEYAELFAIFGIQYGAGDGSSTFNLPNFMGKVPVGYNPSETEFNTIGKTGGDKTHKLTTTEMPSHYHTADGTLSAGSNGAHQHYSFSYVSGKLASGTAGARVYTYPTTASGNANALTSSAGAHVHDITGNTSSVGGSGAHNNLQPYITTCFIIKAKPTYVSAVEMADYVVEYGSNGAWHYEKYNSGKLICRLAQTAYTFTSGYTTVYVSLAHLGVHFITTTTKYPIIKVFPVYTGDNRAADIVYVPAGLNPMTGDAHDYFGVYGRCAGAVLTNGTHYISVEITGWWK